MSDQARLSQEQAILKKEKEIADYQEKIFGQDGEMMKKRIELVKPIQDKVFNTINEYAKSNGYELVIDLASNPTILYYSPSADKTRQIIQLVK